MLEYINFGQTYQQLVQIIPDLVVAGRYTPSLI